MLSEDVIVNKSKYIRKLKTDKNNGFINNEDFKIKLINYILESKDKEFPNAKLLDIMTTKEISDLRISNHVIPRYRTRIQYKDSNILKHEIEQELYNSSIYEIKDDGTIKAMYKGKIFVIGDDYLRQGKKAITTIYFKDDHMNNNYEETYTDYILKSSRNKMRRVDKVRSLLEQIETSRKISENKIIL